MNHNSLELTFAALEERNTRGARLSVCPRCLRRDPEGVVFVSMTVRSYGKDAPSQAKLKGGKTRITRSVSLCEECACHVFLAMDEETYNHD